MRYGKEGLPFPTAVFSNFLLFQQNVEQFPLRLLLFYVPVDRHFKSSLLFFIFHKLNNFGGTYSLGLAV
jgi:hypothetical protein